MRLDNNTRWHIACLIATGVEYKAIPLPEGGELLFVNDGGPLRFFLTSGETDMFQERMPIEVSALVLTDLALMPFEGMK